MSVRGRNEAGVRVAVAVATILLMAAVALVIHVVSRTPVDRVQEARGTVDATSPAHAMTPGTPGDGCSMLTVLPAPARCSILGTPR